MFSKKTYQIKKNNSDIETHEFFLDKLAKEKEDQMGISEKKFEIPLNRKIIYFFRFFFFFISIIFLSKIFYLQVLKGEQLYAISENNKGKVNVIAPERGIIYDRNLKKLVLNAPAYDLACDKRDYIDTNDQFTFEIKEISQILGKNEQEIRNIIASSGEPKVLIAENINHHTLLILETKIINFLYCKIEKNTIRNYTMGPIFSHVLGYTGKPNKEELQSIGSYTITDRIGKTGLEKTYEQYLRGIPGKTKTIKGSGSNNFLTEIISTSLPGNNLILNIDSDLQKIVYEALEKSIKNVGAKKGAAVVLNPNTGAVLAIVSYPAYDNNVFSTGISKSEYNQLINDLNQPFFNRAISAQYPTGSTIKPFLASGALQENIISPTTLIHDPGYILIHSQYDPAVTYRFGGVQPHGLVDMRKAIAVSSNIYFYTIGGGYENQQGLGPARIKKYLELYGWGEKTGIDLPGEYSGFVPSPDWKKQYKKESWWDGDTYNLSIGQSDLRVTPLHVASAYSYIANGGILYKPQVVQKIISGTPDSPQIITEFKPEIIRQNFIDPENLQVIREGMLDSVIKPYGSASMLANLPIAVAAKTGTAEIGRENKYNTWVSAFAPYENPKIVLTITIENVEGLRPASLPVAKEILEYFFSR